MGVQMVDLRRAHPPRQQRGFRQIGNAPNEVPDVPARTREGNSYSRCPNTRRRRHRSQQARQKARQAGIQQHDGLVQLGPVA